MSTEVENGVTGSAPRLGPFGKTAVVSFVGIALVALFGALFVFDQVDEFTLILVVIWLVIAALTGTGWRWAMVVATIIATLLAGVGILFLSPALTRPSDKEFIVVLPMLVFVLLGAVSIWTATIKKFRGGEGPAPGWLSYGLVALAFLVLGAVAVSAIPEEGSVAGINEAALADLPEITTIDFAFDRSTFYVTEGETVAIRLHNKDTSAHTFDIDELDVHAPMPSGESSLAFFRPTEPGQYTFYCAIPGHANLEEHSGMVGTLIVEPAS